MLLNLNYTIKKDFKFLGSKTDQHQQLANAAPPLLGLAISNNIKEYLENV